MDKTQYQRERDWQCAILGDAKMHAITAGILFILSIIVGMSMALCLSFDDSVARTTGFFAPYTSIDSPSIIAASVLLTALAPFSLLRPFTVTLKNLIAGAIGIAVALTTGSLAGIITIAFIGTVLGFSSIPVQAFLHAGFQIISIWCYAAFIIAIVLGIGNAGILFGKSGDVHP